MIEKTILTEWFTTNQNYEKAYEDFPTKRTWNKKIKWNKRKYGFKIGCLYYEIQLSCGKFYSRMLLMVVERAKNYNIIKTYNQVLYNTLKDACSARGLSNNNDE